MTDKGEVSQQSEREPLASSSHRRTFLASMGAAAWMGALGETAHGRPAPPAVSSQAIDSGTIAAAEKLTGINFTEAERRQILSRLETHLETFDLVRAAGLGNGEPPDTVFDPRPASFMPPAESRPAVWREVDVGKLPSSPEDIAFAPLAHLAAWLDRREITSEALTKLYLERLYRIGPKLKCVVTLCEELALAQARQADRELAAGRRRGPLHGIPWGAKDLFDTQGVATTWGAGPFKDRVADRDATVVKKLGDAGAVLVAKLTLGALAYGDVWFGGVTRNPWNPEQGSSGSSAGSAAAVAAGLVGFTLGTETYGSIASPSARCGATGLRPTFGLVSRQGAMALCWSLDKIGPICRSAEDCAFVVDAIAGRDPADPSTTDVPLNLDLRSSVKGVRVGFLAAEYARKGSVADHATLEALRRLEVDLLPVDVPDRSYHEVLRLILDVESAAAFDELTRNNLDDGLRRQDDRAWPNTFRRARLIPAVEYVQARRLRRRFLRDAERVFDGVALVVAPQSHAPLHPLTNMTGHPALTIRQQFRDDGTPGAVTLWGRLFEESALLRVGAALERELGLWERRPQIG